MKDLDEHREFLRKEKEKEHLTSLKIRAWVPSVQKMVYQENFYEWKNGGMLGVMFERDGIKAEFHTDNFIDTEVQLMKCTTIIDKYSEKNIYIGDIVLSNDSWHGLMMFTVEWEDNSVVFKNDQEELYIDYYGGQTELGELKVIGNIYQNENLLNKFYKKQTEKDD